MAFGTCRICGREFWSDSNNTVGWLGSLDMQTGTVEEGECDTCAACWYAGWYKDPPPIGTGDPDWNARPDSN
jgi:hypothetical protein